MDRSSFYIGGFRAVDWDSLLFAGPYVLLGLAAAVLLAGRVNVLILGDEGGGFPGAGGGALPFFW